MKVAARTVAQLWTVQSRSNLADVPTSCFYGGIVCGCFDSCTPLFGGTEKIACRSYGMLNSTQLPWGHAAIRNRCWLQRQLPGLGPSCWAGQFFRSALLLLEVQTILLLYVPSTIFAHFRWLVLGCGKVDLVEIDTITYVVEFLEMICRFSRHLA